MSQSTPSKESRIERHLMRQRGAGVRAITADFGFSFAPSIVPGTAGSEPPTKRRKVAVDGDSQCETKDLRPREGNDGFHETRAVTSYGDAIEAPPQAEVLNHSTRVFERSETVTEPQALDIHSAKVRENLPGRRRKKEEVRREATSAATAGAAADVSCMGAGPPEAKNSVSTVVSDTEKKVPRRVPRPRKKAAAHDNGAGENDVDDSFVAGLKPRKNATKGSKKEAVKTAVEPIPSEALQPIAAKTVPLEPLLNPAKKPANSKRKVKDFDDPNEVPASPFHDRPRRKAATNATEKVTRGFEDETTSVDQLRRAAEPAKPLAKGQKRRADSAGKSSMAPMDEPQPVDNIPLHDDEAHISTVPVKKRATRTRPADNIQLHDDEVHTSTVPVKKRATRTRKAPPKRANPVEVSAKLSKILGDDRLEHDIHTATGRTPKPPAPVARVIPNKKRGKNALDEEITEGGSPTARADPTAKLRRGNVATSSPRAIEATRESLVPEDAKGEPKSRRKVATASRSRVRDKSQSANLPSDTTEPAKNEQTSLDQMSAQGLNNVTAQSSHADDSAKPATKRKRKIQALDATDQDPRDSRASNELTRKTTSANKRQALALTDGNIVRLSLSPEKFSSKTKQGIATVDTVPTNNDTDHEGLPAPAQSENPSKPKRRIAADDEWLFAASEAKRQRAPATGKAKPKQQSGAVRRLDSIAGFAG